MSPTRNIYVREGDMDILDEAEKRMKQNGSSLSALVVVLLDKWVSEAKRGDKMLKDVIANLGRKGFSKREVIAAKRFLGHFESIGGLKVAKLEAALEHGALVMRNAPTK